MQSYLNAIGQSDQKWSNLISYDLNRTPDGSSGGTAASVAANFGYEQQNSIRQKSISK